MTKVKITYWAKYQRHEIIKGLLIIEKEWKDAEERFFESIEKLKRLGITQEEIDRSGIDKIHFK